MWLPDVGQEILSLQLREWLVREADVMEGTVNSQCTHILSHVEAVGRIGGIQDEVEGKGPILRPILLVGSDKLLGTKFLCIVFFVGAM